MDHVLFESRPGLERPVMACAFRGWNDGGEAATTAVAYLRDRWEAQRYARLDPEDFVDFQVTRPTVRLVDGVSRRIEWPASDFYHARPAGRDVLLFLGTEPNMRWRTFTNEIVEVATEAGVEAIITLGAFLADVPHTAPTPLAGSAPDPAEAERLGVAHSRYEGPTGIVGVLHDAAVKAGVPSISLWAAVPHYIPGGPNPKAALALVRKFLAHTGLDVETDTLVRAADTWEAQVSETIDENAELRAYVKRLEETAGERPGMEMASGEALAAELERFLRQQREGDEG